MTKLKTLKPKFEEYELVRAAYGASKRTAVAKVTAGKERAEIEATYGPFGDRESFIDLNKHEAKELGEALIELSALLPEPKPKTPRKKSAKKAVKGAVKSTKDLDIDRSGGAYEPTEEDEF